MENQGGESAAEAAIVTTLHLICQTQGQQLQAYTHHTQAILDMAEQQAEDRSNMREFMGRAGGDVVAALPMPAAEADRSLTRLHAQDGTKG